LTAISRSNNNFPDNVGKQPNSNSVQKEEQQKTMSKRINMAGQPSSQKQQQFPDQQQRPKKQQQFPDQQQRPKSINKQTNPYNRLDSHLPKTTSTTSGITYRLATASTSNKSKSNNNPINQYRKHPITNNNKI
jgi:hypothetical protein